MKLSLGDVFRLKKPHPCGNYLWEVVGLGADIGLRRTRCNRRVMIDWTYLERRVKEVLPVETPCPEARSVDEE